uniref:Sde2 N-terminal ubiquitin domain-containing protein n=1 Tax=Meloidogyne javanica TaxID=6303 RepID=A0A915MVE4_MELJA
MLIRSHFTHDDNAMVNMVNSLPPETYFLECDGSVHEELGTIQKGKLIQLHFRLCGGKGGFGSLLRSFRIHKSNNQLMCRNLAGRRLADVREEERLKKYIEKKEQREKEKKKKEEEKIDKLKNGAKTKHEFTDQEYLRKRDTVLDVVEDAVEAGVLALKEKHKADAKVENNDVSTDVEEFTGPSTSSNIQEALTASNVNDEQNSDSDESLDDLMSCGPLKKKVKIGYKKMASVDEVTSELDAQIPLALRALQEYDGRKQEKKLPLFPDTKKIVYLTVKYKRPFFKKSGNRCVFVTQPYPDRNPSNSSVCLILPDLDRSKKAQTDPDVDKQAREWEERLRENYGLISGVNYTKILTFIQLTREYTEIKDRVKLANLYDIFFVDYKLTKKVEYFMGKFRPILIKAEQNFSKRIEEAYNQTLIFFMPMNDAITIRVGNLNQKIKHLKSNTSTIISSLLEDFPGGSINIRSVYLQTLDVSLPIYVDFGSSNEINFELPPEPELVEIVGECSTLPEGLEVKVRADGLVTTVEKKSGEEVLYPTEQDEWEKEDDMKPLNAELIQKILRKGK